MDTCFKCNSFGEYVLEKGVLYRCTTCGYEFSRSKTKGSVYVYFIRCNDGSIYTGVSNDVYRRYEAHLVGKGAKYTKIKGVYELITYRKFTTRSEGLKVEHHIKSLTTEKKRQLIRSWKQIQS